MIDTHAHIYLPEFNEDRSEVIERAKSAGIKHIILPNVDSTTINDLLTVEASDKIYLHAAMGLHPTSVKEDWESELDIIWQKLNSRAFCAIGEIGVDLYWDKTFLEEQIIVFEKQLEWAINFNLPVIIHVRNAFPEALSSVKKMNCENLRGVFHSFSGGLQEAKEVIALGGFMLGINGVLTFKNSGIKEFLPQVPLEYIVLETDAPYLSPVPYRGKRNEPAYVHIVAEKLAEVYQTSLSNIVEATTANSLRLFSNIKQCL